MLRIGGQEIPIRTVLLALSEGLLVFAGLLVATCVRSFVSGGDWVPGRLGGLTQIAVAALICEVSLYYNDIYDLRVPRSRISIIVRLLEAFGISCLVLAFLYAVMPGLALRRGVAITAAPLTLVMILSWRLLLDAAGVMSRRSERVVLLGTGPIGIAAVREICTRPELNLDVIGFLDEDPRNVGKPLVNPGIVATVDDLEQIVREKNVDRVVLSLKEQRGHMPTSALLRLKFAGVAVEDAGALLERVTGRISVERRCDPSRLILSDGFRQSQLVAFVKRTVDVLFSSTLLLISLPILGVVALAILCESGFPILFRQKRIGLHRRPFEIMKFRSMYQNAEATGPSWAEDGDRRITRVGRVIRKYRLDEIPQVWNVLRGDMSLVGPRPEQPFFCDLLEEKIPLFEQRYQVRPGITGWAQVRYQYGASIEDALRKLEYDLFYIKHLSVTLDMVIILETVKVVLWARGSK